MHRLTAGESTESLWLALEGTSVSHPSCQGSGSVTEWKTQSWGRGAMKQCLLDVTCVASALTNSYQLWLLRECGPVNIDRKKGP